MVLSKLFDFARRVRCSLKSLQIWFCV